MSKTANGVFFLRNGIWVFFFICGKKKRFLWGKKRTEKEKLKKPWCDAPPVPVIFSSSQIDAANSDVAGAPTFLDSDARAILWWVLRVWGFFFDGCLFCKRRLRMTVWGLRRYSNIHVYAQIYIYIRTYLVALPWIIALISFDPSLKTQKN